MKKDEMAYLVPDNTISTFPFILQVVNARRILSVA